MRCPICRKEMLEQECEEYAQKLTAEDTVYQKARANLEKERLRAKAIRRYTRFMRVSFYPFLRNFP